MVEIEKKYEIYEKKFDYVNWIGFWTLYKKEVLRFLIVAIQTVVSPLVTSLLFLLVLSLAIGNERDEILGFPFITFLAPGLIAMQVIQQAFSHSSSSIMIGKIQGNIAVVFFRQTESVGLYIFLGENDEDTKCLIFISYRANDAANTGVRMRVSIPLHTLNVNMILLKVPYLVP